MKAHLLDYTLRHGLSVPPVAEARTLLTYLTSAERFGRTLAYGPTRRVERAQQQSPIRPVEPLQTMKDVPPAVAATIARKKKCGRYQKGFAYITPHMPPPSDPWWKNDRKVPAAANIHINRCR